MDFQKQVASILQRYDTLSQTLSYERQEAEAYIATSKELATLEPIVGAMREWQTATDQLEALKLLQNEEDTEIQELAALESQTLQAKLLDLQHSIQEMLLPDEEDKIKNVILEVRPGTGGQEASLFAGKIFDMYQRYALLKGWSFETLSLAITDIGGFKEAIAAITGDKAFSYLKFESGVHRVQRIPITEANGRIHTSTVTVAVLAEAEEIDVKIEEKDLRIDVFRASGPGGQSVNTTDSAVRVTHLPSGLVVSQQDQKSQYRNKMTALRILRTRLKNLELQIQQDQRSNTRKKQIGRGDRSERIRTYNFPQGRVTDHRIQTTLHKIEAFLNGELLDEFIQSLLREEKASKLVELES